MKQKVMIAVTALLIFLLLGGVLMAYSSTRSKSKESFNLGNKYLEEGEYQEAVIAFEKVIKVEPRNIEARVKLAKAYVGLGKNGEAERVLKEAAGIDEKRVEPYLALGELYTGQGKLEEAISVLEKAYDITKNEEIKKMLDKLRDQLSGKTKSPADTAQPSTDLEDKNIDITIKTEEVDKENASADFYMYGFNEKGEKVWTQKWGDLMLTELSVASKHVIYKNKVIIEVYGSLYGLELASGKILWKADGTGACAHAPVIDPEDGTIYVSGYYGPLITAVNADGSIKWRKDTPSDSEIFWPYSIELKGEQVIVKTEGGRAATLIYDKKGNLIKEDGAGNGQPAQNSNPNFKGVVVINVTASSYLTEKTVVHYPERICDNDNSTAWVEGAPQDGIGEYVQLNFQDEGSVSSVSLINGYAKSDTAYYSNNRVKKVKLSFSDGSSATVDLQDNIKDYQVITLNKSVNTSYVRLTILEVYKGTKYTDTCISGVKIN